MDLEELSNNAELIEVARQAIENELIERRNNGIGMIRGNGLVCRSKDGEPSSIIRMGPEEAMKIGLRAINKYLINKENNNVAPS